jgi:hypothetical protein
MEHLKGNLGCQSGVSVGALFLALTFVLVIIIVLMCRNTTTALVIIGLLLGFGAACAAAGGGLGPGKPGALAGGNGVSTLAAKDGFCPLPGAPAPYAVATPSQPHGPPPRYRGAIDIDEYDTEGEFGHRDRTDDDVDSVPMGNPFDSSRIYSPTADGPCFDDEANDAEIDGDESAVYQGTHRNDATRVIAGTMNRRRDMDRYFREELEEEEDRRWWGRHED